jgi:hypothetical protein
VDNLGEEKTEWQRLYEVAVLETNPALSRQKVAMAERAVAARLRELVFCAEQDEEKQSLRKTKIGLRALRNSPWVQCDRLSVRTHFT